MTALFTMYDSTDASAVPPDAVGFGYVDGLFAWSDAGWADHPRCFGITVFGSLSALVADCESGDMTPQQAANWARNKIVGGHGRPCIYTGIYVIDSVKQALGNLQIGRDVDWWVPDYDGVAEIPSGAVAKQYLGNVPGPHGGIVDISVSDGWPLTAPPPPPAPLPPPAPPGPPVNYPGDHVIQQEVTVQVKGGKGWIALPAPLVSAQPLTENPEVVGRYDNVPSFLGVASQSGPHSPHGVAVFGGMVPDGNYGVVLTLVG